MFSGPAVAFKNVLNANPFARVLGHVEAHSVGPGFLRKTIAAAAGISNVAAFASPCFVRLEDRVRSPAFAPVCAAQRQPRRRRPGDVLQPRGRVKIRAWHSPGIVTRRDMATNRMEILKSMLAQNPGDTFARYGLAMEYAKSGELARAVAEFEALLDSNPDYAAAYFHGGQALEKLARIEDARAMYEKGVQAASRIGDRHAAGELQAALDLLPI